VPDPVADQLRVLSAGTARVLPAGELERRLSQAATEGRPLRIKLGIDPSSSHLTLGHAVVLRKLAQFQRFGHTIVLIIGSFTGMVGDPTGRSETRRRQTAEEVAANARTYLEQVGRILDVDAAEVRSNADWLAPMTFAEVVELAANATVAQLLEREDFRNRYTGGQPISLAEFLYPLMQGMDSVAVKADVELGGTDQEFNLLVGRDLQRAHGQPGQIVMTVPLLEGIDGRQKMSKSLDNGVYLDEPAEAQFGKLMSIPDTIVPRYLELTTDLHPDQVEELTATVKAGGARAAAVKRRLASEVVTLYHGPEAAAKAEAAFDAGVSTRRGHTTDDDVPELLVPAESIDGGRVWVVALLADAGLVKSRGEARRLVTGGAVRLDGEPVDAVERTWPAGELDGRLLTVGRRTPLRLRVP
jgi:tyrosyl-tRNA synthetase